MAEIRVPFELLLDAKYDTPLRSNALNGELTVKVTTTLADLGSMGSWSTISDWEGELILRPKFKPGHYRLRAGGPLATVTWYDRRSPWAQAFAPDRCKEEDWERVTVKGI